MKYGWLLVLIFIGASEQVAAAENGISCSDCSYSEAKLLAEQQAAPKIHCVITRSPDEDYVEQCSSLTKQFFVLNETSREIYPFTVTHLNQKQPKQQLVAWASDRTMTTAYQQQILRALDAKLAIPQLLQQISQQFNKTIDIGVSQFSQPSKTAMQQSIFGASMQSNTRSATSDCANDQHVAAVKAAMDPQYATQLQVEMNRALVNQVNSSFFSSSVRSAFEEFNISSVGVSGSRNGLEINITWEKSIGGKHFVQVYSKHGQREREESSLVWSVKLDANETVKVELDQASSIIDNLKLSDLLRTPEWSQQMKISPCLAQELAKHAPRTEIDPATKDEINRFYELGSNVIGSNFDQGGGGWICQYTFFDRHGSIIAQFLTLCP